MSTSTTLLDQNFNANHVDIMVLNLAPFPPPCGGLARMLNTWCRLTCTNVDVKLKLIENVLRNECVLMGPCHLFPPPQTAAGGKPEGSNTIMSTSLALELRFKKLIHVDILRSITLTVSYKLLIKFNSGQNLR